MIYSFHHFYYWMKGGVETGMAYRARIFRELGLDAKFVFATTFPDDNIQHETEYLGFLDSEVIWMFFYRLQNITSYLYVGSTGKFFWNKELYFIQRREDCNIYISRGNISLCGLFNR